MDLNRLVLILVIWGLAVQPLMAVVPARRMVDDAPHMMFSAVDSSAIHAETDLNNQALLEVPCHKDMLDQAAMHCANCDADCGVNGVCTSGCLFGGVAILQHAVLNSGFSKSFVKSDFSDLSFYHFPSQIFHPPKYA